MTIINKSKRLKVCFEGIFTIEHLFFFCQHYATKRRPAFLRDALSIINLEETRDTSIISSSFMIYYSIPKTKSAKKTKLLFHKVVKLHSHAVSCGHPSHKFRHFLPCQIFEYLILNNPLHPERNLFHPLLDLDLQFLSLPLLYLEDVLLAPDQIGVSVSLGCPGDPETLRLIREVRIAAPYLVDHGLSALLQALDLRLRLLDIRAGVYVVIQYLLVHYATSPYP